MLRASAQDSSIRPADDTVQQQAWEQCKAALEAKGEHLDLDYFIPPSVPDDKNFALTPLLKPLLDLVKKPDKVRAHIYHYVPRDPNPPVATIDIKVEGSKANYPFPSAWETGHARQLEAWQAYYRESLPALGLSKSPAEDVLTALGQWDVMLAELRREMQARPLCRYPLHYELGVGLPMPHCFVLQGIVRVVSLRASAELALNRPDEAFTDLEFGYRLADPIGREPTLISGLARMAMTSALVQAAWEGIAAHRWNAEQLAGLEKEFQRWDTLADFSRRMRMERVLGNLTLEKLHSDSAAVANPLLGLTDKALGLKDGELILLTVPAYLASIYQNEIFLDTFIQENFLGLMNEKLKTINVARAQETQKALDDLPATPSNYLAKKMMSAYGAVLLKFAQWQTSMNEGAVACEIERYRLAHGKLPATLEALQMPGLPHDVINGQPLHYRVTGDDYVLYSVGGNEQDDGGKIVLKPNTTGAVPDAVQGDWVWTLKPL